MSESQKQGPNASRDLYPGPVPVITSTIIAHAPGDSNTVVLVELATPGADGKRLVLPGGIWDLKKHPSPMVTGVTELEEETGLMFEGPPEMVAISTRRSVDRRRWCSHDTAHCCDFILAGPASGTIKVNDTAEVRQARFYDLSTLDLSTVGRGHDMLLKAWMAMNEPTSIGGVSDNKTIVEYRPAFVMIRDR